MYNNKIIIKETSKEDLEHLLSLWNNGEVMNFVGFPKGLGETMIKMKQWLSWIEDGRPKRNHYSVYTDDFNYCGETFYDIDKGHGNSASLDIKLVMKARGKGIATKALSHSIEQAFTNGAEKVWVDPNPANEKAIALYRRLGFFEKEMPEYLKEDECDCDFVPAYMELTSKQWYKENH